MNRLSQLEVRYHDTIVGHIALANNGLCVFEYTAQWLSEGFSISPFELPLRNGVFTAKPRPFDGGFGVFDDCLPDGWGMLILDRYLKSKGIALRELSILDRLALVGTSGRGALEFHPDRSLIADNEYTDFEKLALESQQILNSEDCNDASIEELMRRGGSPGGARPKIFATYNDKEWLIKFRAKYDPANIGIEEYNYSLLAKDCGIEMPLTRLFDDKFFGVERFDRELGTKIHTVSVAGLLGADYRLPSIDYTHILKVCAILTNSKAEMWKVYRLMVFNYLIDNKDDHAKNFAFIHKNGNWHFAPAFDLLPSSGMNGYRTSSINDSITPNDHDLLAVASKNGLDIKIAQNILDSLKNIIANKV